MLFGAQFRTCGILGKNEMEWQNYLPSKSRMEPCESKTPLYLFSHPPTLDLEEAGGDGRAGRNFPSTIKPVLSGHPGERRTDYLIQVDLLITAGLANLREYSGKIKMVKEKLISIPRQNDLKVFLPPLVQKKGSKHFMGW